MQSLQDLGRDRGEGGYLVGAQAVEDEPSHRVDMGRRGLLDGSATGVGEDNKCAPTARDALYASKVVAYAQGFEQIAAASEAYGWGVELGGLATIWRGGCIIRARFLDRIREAYAADPGLRPGQPAPGPA